MSSESAHLTAVVRASSETLQEFARILPCLGHSDFQTFVISSSFHPKLCILGTENIVECRQKAGMIEEIRVDFLGNDHRSHDSG
jgi:hypothetical protein